MIPTPDESGVRLVERPTAHVRVWLFDHSEAKRVIVAEYDELFSTDQLHRNARNGAVVYAERIADGAILGVLAPTRERAFACRNKVARKQQRDSLDRVLLANGGKVNPAIKVSAWFRAIMDGEAGAA